MGGEQAANVLVSVKEEQLRSRGKVFPEESAQQMRDEILAKFQKESSAYYSTSRIWDDGIIDPVDTRKVLALGIAASLNKKFESPSFGIFRM